MEEENTSSSIPDSEVAAVLNTPTVSTCTTFRQGNHGGSQSLPSFSNAPNRSHSSNSDTVVKQQVNSVVSATELTNVYRGNKVARTPDHVTSECETSVHHLAAQGEIAILKEVMTNIDEEDHSGFTPLFWACCYDQLHTVKFLVDRGANINHTGTDGDTALAIACNKGHHRVVSYLAKECKSNVNISNNFGNGALHYAVKQNNLKSVKILLENGADFTHRNKKGVSAFDLAIELKFRHIQKEIENHLLNMLQ